MAYLQAKARVTDFSNVWVGMRTRCNRTESSVLLCKPWPQSLSDMLAESDALELRFGVGGERERRPVCLGGESSNRLRCQGGGEAGDLERETLRLDRRGGDASLES